MTTTIKRVSAVCLCIVMMFSFMTVASAEETAPTLEMQNGVTREDLFEATSKTFSLHMSETHGYVKSEPSSLALWEQPILESGQSGIVCEMTVTNGGKLPATLEMEPVPLPYHDEQAMTYLNYVMLKITDRETGEVLFHDSYAHINDPVTDARATTTTATAPSEGEPAQEQAAAPSQGFTLTYPNMQPGETHTYQIEMRCLSTYDGEAPTTVEMPWSFKAQTKTSGVQEVENKLPEWVEICLIGLAATIALLIVVAIVRAIGAFVKKRKNPVDNEE